MSKLYGISDNTISSGLLELEDKGIIEVTRDKPARKYLAGKPTPPDFATHRFVTRSFTFVKLDTGTGQIKAWVQA